MIPDPVTLEIEALIGHTVVGLELTADISRFLVTPLEIYSTDEGWEVWAGFGPFSLGLFIG